MYPPTPTALPAGAPPIQAINVGAFRIWSFTDDALMMWNSWLGPTWTQVAQIAIILGILILFVSVTIRWLQGINDEVAL